ncbi:hypothetical protein J6524_16885 [Bradyrhizobium sp. WSM 1738]|uniref:hypothetical protein n=1 Tax=Bradyrhizobium hereditatis TaxID=2821405 RepID=UPI001CE35AFD|nr:hypothetical protein [Bradyrhizobium hereditatis]MCA6116560.1 hypothetical protein [Bradyrhizobium hereditatis]
MPSPGCSGFSWEAFFGCWRFFMGANAIGGIDVAYQIPALDFWSVVHAGHERQAWLAPHDGRVGACPNLPSTADEISRATGRSWLARFGT